MSKSKYHYVYRITNTLTNMHYYGSRSSELEPKLDLGHKYFSSSRDKDFIDLQKSEPNIFKYKIMTFKTRELALLMEIKLHNKFDVARNPNFYNKAKQTSTGWDTTGTTQSLEANKRNSELNKGIPKSEEHKTKISKSLKGRNLSEANKRNLSVSRTGKHYPKLSEVQRKFWYYTPLGIFDHARALEPLITKPTLLNWCKNPDKLITKNTWRQVLWLKTTYKFEDLENKTFRDIGFYMVEKSISK